MMDFWTIISIIGGVGVAAGLVNYFTGGLVSEVASSIFSAFKDFLLFVAGNMPAPLKFMIVVVLLVSVGGIIYNFSIGANKVCLQDEVHEVGYIEGFFYKMWPKIDVISLDPLEIVTENYNNSDEGGWITEVNGVTYVFASPDEGDFDRGSFFFGLFSSDVQKETYNVCYDEDTSICTIENSCGLTGTVLGSISYEYHSPTGNFLSSFHQLEGGPLRGFVNFFTGSSSPTLDSCGKSDVRGGNEISFEQKGETYHVPIHGGVYARLGEEEDDGDVVLTKEDLTRLEETDRGKELKKLLSNSEPVENDGVLKYYCQEDSAGTKLEVAGVDPFSKGFLLFISLVTVIFTIRSIIT